MKALKLFLFAAVALVFAACGADEAKKVAEKISANQPLTESDYTVMINYVGDYAKEAQPIQDAIDNLPDASEKADADTRKLADLTEKYPYFDIFSQKISTCTEAQVGKENADKINSYAGYTWFTAPDWSQIPTDPGVAGMIEEMPQSDSSGVIASGAGEAVKE